MVGLSGAWRLVVDGGEDFDIIAAWSTRVKSLIMRNA